MRKSCCLAVIILIGLSFLPNSRAEDAFYRVSLKDLKFVDGKLIDYPAEGYSFTKMEMGELLEPAVRLESTMGTDAEAYISFGAGPWNSWSWNAASHEKDAIVVRAPMGKDISGRLLVPSEGWKSLVTLRFAIAASTADPKAREVFYQAKEYHYESLLQRHVPGAAWFRHEARSARRALGVTKNDPTRPELPQRDQIEDTYELFSGGRAISENLQLDRVLLPRGAGGQEATVPVDSIEGITVKEMDWKPLIAGQQPALDPLASLIPADQHAIFFPSFEAATSLMDEMDKQGTPILQAAEPRSEDAGVKQRYQRQLCLPLTGLGRLLGPKLISSMAFTGSDPYLRVGSDVAILFEPKDLNALRELLRTQMSIASAGGAAAPVEGKLGDVAYGGFVSPDRRVCAYVATIGDTLIVTNSLVQLQHILDAKSGQRAALAAAPEYVFFRERYHRDDASESGFIVLTDAAIRRWCSPRWRIGDSRRTRAAAVLAEAQARHVDDLAMKKAQTGPITDDAELTGVGDLKLGAAGAESSLYGTLEFMTPIAEMDLTKVTQAEADNYKRWRDTYQQNWRNYFDPIAVRLSSSNKTLAADLTVMPLIAGTEYHEFVAISEGAKLLPSSGDPHNAALHFALAINPKSERMRSLSKEVSQFIPQLKIEPFSWIGPSAAFYVDDDPIWEKAAQSEKPQDFFRDHLSELPVAIYIESSNNLKMALFLTGLHAFVDVSAPGLMVWENLTHREQPYTKISATQAGRGAVGVGEKDLAIYYSTAGGALVISPNEALIKRSIDRQMARAATRPSTQPAKVASTLPAAMPWIGENYCAQIDMTSLRKVLQHGLLGPSYESELRRESWSNLPILNEWKRRFPDLDPVDLHQRLWQARLIDPAGGSYTWNAKLETMESTLYGCPQAPKSGPAFPPALDTLLKANFGLTFENQGLRARVELHR